MKKRLLKGCLIVLLLVCVYAMGTNGVLAAAAEQISVWTTSLRYDLEVTEPALKEYADGSGIFKANAVCAKDAVGKEIRVAVAFYNNDGRMLDCWIASHTLTATGEISVAGTVPVYDKVGVYFFDSESLTPIRPAVLRLLDGQVTDADTKQLLAALEQRLEEQEAAITQLTREMDSLLNGFSGGILLSQNDGQRTVTDGGVDTTSSKFRSTITGWTTYMTKDIMFGDADSIDGMILSSFNIEQVEGFETVKVEVQLRNFDDTATNHIVPTSVLIKSYTTEVKPQGICDYHLLIPISRCELEELDDEFLLGIRVVNTGTPVRMEFSKNDTCLMKEKNSEKLPDNENCYKYVGYYTRHATPSNSFATFTPDITFSRTTIRDFSSIIDNTLTKSGRAADAGVVGVAISALSKDSVKLQLPEYYDLVAGDTFELFYKGILNCVDYSHYEYDLSISGWAKDAVKGYTRKAVLNPTEEHVGTHTLQITVRDNGGYEVDRDTVELRVHPVPTAPEKETVILCMGDSLTSGGYWPSELYRRLTATDGTPTGYGLTNLKFIGTKVKDGANYEGTGGWTYSRYLSEDSPFWNAETGEIDFAAYAAGQGVDHIDHTVILLGWNNTGNDEETYKTAARTLLDKLYEAFPDCQVTLLGLQVPSQDGLGHSYGISWKYYDKLQFVWNHQLWNQELCKEESYAGKMTFASIAGQFDTEYNMPTAKVAANTRTDTTETIGTNGVHPSVNGYYQIADAVLRHLAGKLN